MEKIKQVILCADDYGQKSSVSQAIVQLLQSKRLSAVSCMVTKPDWQANANLIRPFLNQMDLGLHFNLTEGQPLSAALKSGQGFKRLGRLLLMALAGRCDRRAITAELEAQLDAFSAAFGQLPDFIDGHQHVQHFPGVRDALLAVYTKRLQQTNCYIRCVDDRTVWQLDAGLARFKRCVLQLSGAATFRRALEVQGIPHNQSFSGVYPFAKSARYAEFFPQFLARVQQGGLILCHPGMGESDPGDPISLVRGNEYHYLAGNAFPEACRTAGVRLARFSEMYPVA